MAPTTAAAVPDTNHSAYRIKSLDSPDAYPVWRIQMQDILSDLNLWIIVDGTSTVPATGADEIAAWTAKDRKALSAIQLRISGSMITYVINATSSKAAWESLESVFNIQGAISQILIRRKLLRYTIEDGANMEEEVRTLRGYKEQLALLKDKIDDDQFALIILTALPKSWDSFIGSIDVSNLTSVAIIGRILAEDSTLR